MDRIEKFLQKLSRKERNVAQELIQRIVVGDTDGLDIKKLHGYRDVFRLRKGKLRIIYKQDTSGAKIFSVDKRDDNTYRDL